MNEESFFSINKLVEFGFSMAIAQQMIKTMNDAMVNMHIPGAMHKTQNEQHALYFVIVEGHQAGPLSEAEIIRLVSEGKINKSSYVWRPGLSNWALAETLPEIVKMVALMPPPFSHNTGSSK
jgi:hypothetical protein